VLEWRAHRAALLGLSAALAVSVFVYGMPARTAAATTIYGAAYGFLPIGWIVLNALFLYSLTVATGQFDVLKASVGRLSDDRRIQALLVAFAFGAFIEGASGFGTPVAICSALLIGLGFTPLYAAGLSLIANTAPVAFGAIGTPILTLGAVTGIPATTIGVMAGRQLPFVSLIVPAWLIVTMSGWRGLRAVWPAVVLCGGTFAIVQFAWSNYVGVELVDIAGGLASIALLALFCRVWQPRDHWSDDAVAAGAASDAGQSRVRPGLSQGQATSAGSALPARPSAARAWMPWLFLSIAVIVWGLPATKAALSGPVLSPSVEVPLLNRTVFRDFPVASATRRIARVTRKQRCWRSIGRRRPAPRSCWRRSPARCTRASRHGSCSPSRWRRSGACARRSPRS
jgi:lactate permease